MRAAVLPCGFTAQPVDPAAGPPGTWQDAGEQTGLHTCASTCGKQGLNFGAMLPLGENRFKCWCSEAVDMSAYDTTIPEVGGHAQILDLTDVIKAIFSASVEIYHVHHARR